MTPELYKLLERYHDQEVSPEEAAEVEALLERDVEALELLGAMDEANELLRETADLEMASVSFEGFWSQIQARIQEEEETAMARKVAAQPGPLDRLGAWLRELFVEHKSAWITAAATAAAVALVLSFMDIGGAPDPNEGVPIVQVERHIIYVDSVDKADPESTVLVNSIKGQGSDTKVIWLVPNPPAGSDEAQAEDDSDDGIEIVEEPL